MTRPGGWHPGTILGGFALLLAAAVMAFGFHSLSTRIDDLVGRTAAAEEQLRIVAGEVTRFRIEQRAEGQGVNALLEKVGAYAALLADARTTEPDFQSAKKEMAAVLRALESLGSDGLPPILARLAALDPQQKFDEVRWLLEAAVRVAPQRGEELVAQALLGTCTWNPKALVAAPPRLRWMAAEMLTRIDKPRAQQLLRQILLTESFRGADPERAAAYHMPALDPAAVATTGFNNFVVAYLRTGDPEAEDTLLQVLQRDVHDVVTLQEVIEELGKRKSARASKRIEELYRHAPGAAENPLFLVKCLDALASIRGEEARPFLEAELAKAGNETVARQISYLLQHLGR